MISEEYAEKDIFNQAYKKTLRKKTDTFKKHKIPYYGISPHEKSVNNIPITDWFIDSKINDIIELKYDPNDMSLNIRSVDEKFK